MKRFSLASLVLVGAVGLAGCMDQGTAPTAPGIAGAQLSTAADVTALSEHIVQFGAGGIPSDFAARVAALGGTMDARYDAIAVAVVSGLSDAHVAAAASGGEVVRIDRNVEMTLLDPTEVQVEEAAASPSDPTTAFFYPRQWHLRAIGADQAWAAGKFGDAGVTVAILDTGIDYTYPDLAGLVDLSRSRSFIPSDDALVQQHFPGAHPVADLHYHGTHVAATVSSNARVAAGVTTKTTLIGVKVLSAAGRGSSASVLGGIMYAAEAGADVVNMSLGGSFNKRDFPGFVSVINRAINYARSQGVVMVVSAGNSALDLDHDKNGYKTYCNAPGVMCISATGPTARDGINGPWYNVDALAWYSNYGRSAISVAAPGGNRGGAVAAGCSKFSLAIPVCQSPTRHFILHANGTSMASPHVSGLAALVVAELGKDQPAAVIARIQQSADDLGKPGVDPAYGKGRINVARALGL